MEIVILDGYTTNPGDQSWESIEKLGKLTVYDRTDSRNREEVISRIGNADIVITNKVKIDEELFEKCPNIKYIGLLSTGYNIVDIEAARKRNIPVCNVPAYSTEAVTQFTMGLLLEICLHIGEYNAEVKSGMWQKSKDFCMFTHPLIELKDKVFGIVGLGNIGKSVARAAKAFGMNVIAYAPRKHEDGEKFAEYVSFDELLKRSDVISLHCPLLPETRGLINKESIEKMKDKVILLNAARGPIIVEEDVAIALESGKIYAAGVDVVNREPILADNPLLKRENCIITPHIAWAATETRKRLIDIAAKNIEGYLNGHLQNVVNL